MGSGSIFCCVSFMTMCLHFAAPLECPPGTYVYTIQRTGEQHCMECEDGTFREQDSPQQTSCKPCEEIREPELEILISPCYKTHDAVIHCVDGYYRDEARNPRETGQCRKCTECKFVGQPCSTYRDTVCCRHENFDVVLNHHGVPICKERPWFCRRGQYFETRNFQCLPCPDKTFMPLDYHIEPECWKCREYDKYESYRPLHSVIMQPCNRTHAPVIRCEDGFFMDPKMGYRYDDTGCSPCTDCSKTDAQYEGRNCDGMEDTVCCPEANMTVHDTPGGPMCMAVSASCDVGYCLRYHTRNRSSTCAPCNNADVGEVKCNPEVFANFSCDIKQNTASQNKTKVRRKTITQTDGNLIGFAFGFGLFITGAIFGILFILFWKYLKTSSFGVLICSKVRWLKERCTGSHMDEATELLNSQNERSGTRQRTTSLSGHSELEQCFGNESDLEAKKNTCPRLQDHANLISEEDFVMDNLPPDFRYEQYLDHIKAVCHLTVRVRVYHVSDDRPEEDPYYDWRGLKGKGLRRFGNGLVYQVSKRFEESNNEDCPCKDCQAFPENAKPNWAEFLVVTSAQIVFDEAECSQTSCKLGYDRDEDPWKIPSLKGWKVKMIDKEKDVCIMRCVSHDPEVTRNLEEKVSLFNTFRDQNQEAPDDVDGTNRRAVTISHPHGLSKRISQRNASAEEGQVGKWTYDDLTCPGSLGAPVCLLSSNHGSKILITIYNGEHESKGFDLDVGLENFNYISEDNF